MDRCLTIALMIASVLLLACGGSDVGPLNVRDGFGTSLDDSGRPSPTDVSMSSVDLGRLFDAEMMTDQSFMDALVYADSFSPMADVGVSVDAEVTATDSGSQEAGIGEGFCPEESAVDRCIFGGTSLQLVEQSGLMPMLTARHYDPSTMSGLEQSAWVFGFACEGIFTPVSAEEAFSIIDQDGLRIYEFGDTSNPSQWAWYRFYMGDTEIGYIFRKGTLSLDALVSDGDIIRCQVGSIP